MPALGLAARAAAAAQVLVGDPACPVIGEEDVHHLGRVLRLRAGDAVVVTDGRGRWALSRWQGRGELEVDGPVEVETRAEPPLTVAFAPAKGDRAEWVVQKLTELGIDRIVPLATRHGVVRWTPERTPGALERLRRVARQAAAQSRRVWLPEVRDPAEFGELSSLGGLGEVVLAQLGGDPPTPAHRVVAIGPEGGWSTDELATGLPTVGLGPAVLRAETAAVTAAALLVALRAGLVAPGGPRGSGGSRDGSS